MLAGKRRTLQENKKLGYSLAFIAGAINAGGFMAVSQYTSHMTGIISLAADNIVIGNWLLATSMLSYILCFIFGAATTTILVIWGRNRHLNSCYALPIAIESALLLVFGVFNNKLEPFYIISLLCFLMGLQNAVITKISNTTIRTTHITGMSTDIGIELGRIIYSFMDRNLSRVLYNKDKIIMHLSIGSLFLFGGIVGAFGFKYSGFSFVLPLATYLFLLAFPSINRDLKIYKYLYSNSK